MMIFLEILKIIGIVLVCIIGLIIVIILLVLFAPFKYCIAGKGENEQIKAGLTVTWLGGLLKLDGGLSPGGFEMKTHLAGLELKKKENSLFSRIAKKAALMVWNMLKKALFGIEPEKPEKASRKAGHQGEEKTDEKCGTDSETSQEKDDDEDSPKIVKTLKNIAARIKKIWELIKMVKYVLGAPVTARAWKYLKEQLIDFFNHVKPYSIAGEVRFGAEDPASTAQIYGVVAPIAAIIDERLMIIPDMENKIISMDAAIKGRILVGYVLSFLWRLLTNKDIRRVVGYIGRNL